jgi:hypothetical protein
MNTHKEYICEKMAQNTGSGLSKAINGENVAFFFGRRRRRKK